VRQRHRLLADFIATVGVEHPLKLTLLEFATKTAKVASEGAPLFDRLRRPFGDRRHCD